MAVYVTKANGSRQLFDKEKVMRTCLRFGATREIAYKIAEKVEQQIYDGEDGQENTIGHLAGQRQRQEDAGPESVFRPRFADGLDHIKGVERYPVVAGEIVVP